MATGMRASGDNISLTIQKDYVVEGGTEYYFYTEDDLGVYSTSGSRDNPPTINFVEADETSIRYDIPVIGGNIFTHFLADAYIHGTYPEFTDIGIDITDLLEKIDTDGDGMISLREGFDYASTNTKRTFDHLFGKQGTPQMDPETEDFTVPQKEPGFCEGVLIFFARSPVYMVVSDPEGRILSKTTNVVGGSAFCVDRDCFIARSLMLNSISDINSKSDHKLYSNMGAIVRHTSYEVSNGNCLYY